MADNLNSNTSRTYLTAQLYKHGCEKLIKGYETDYDLVARSVWRERKMKGVVEE